MQYVLWIWYGGHGVLEQVSASVSALVYPRRVPAVCSHAGSPHSTRHGSVGSAPFEIRCVLAGGGYGHRSGNSAREIDIAGLLPLSFLVLTWAVDLLHLPISFSRLCPGLL